MLGLLFKWRVRARIRVIQVSGAVLMSVSAVLALGLLAFVTSVLVETRETDREKALQSAENVLATIGADIGRNIELYDLSLQAVMDNLKTPEIDRVSGETRQLILFDRAATAKHLGRIHVLDETGRVILDSRSTDFERRDLSSRDYFLAHKEQPDLGLHIGRVFRSRQGANVLSISRRINHPDGSFAGVVAGMLRLEYVQDLFDRVKLGEGSALTLISLEGGMLARSPYIADAIGANFSNTVIHKTAVVSKAGNFEALAGTDGIHRLYTFLRIDNLSLVLTIGLATDQVYAHWRGQAIRIGGIALTLCLAMIGLAAFSARELQRRTIAEKRLKLLAATDTTTGLYNRRVFNSTIDREWKRARRSGLPVALLMIDADNFKSYNDRYGHQAGDTALAAIAACIAGAMRSDTDLAARYGGEEFALLLPGATLKEAVNVAERLRSAVAAVASVGISDNLPCPTISVGAASANPGRSDKWSALIGSADAALYEAKRKGRNRAEPTLPAEWSKAA